MKLPYEIKIKQISSKESTIIEDRGSNLILCETHILSHGNSIVEKEDELGMKKEFEYAWNLIHLKPNISGVDSYWSNTDELWNVAIRTIGRNDDFVESFETQEQALEVQSIILNWLLTN